MNFLNLLLPPFVNGVGPKPFDVNISIFKSLDSSILDYIGLIMYD